MKLTTIISDRTAAQMAELAERWGYPGERYYSRIIETAIDQVYFQEVITMNNKPTYREIAKDWELWCDYIDPDATMTREDFDAMSVDQRVAMIVEIFGKEEND